MRLNKSHKNRRIDSVYFKTIYEELYVDLCRFCLQYLRDEEIAKEIVQDQFVYLWEKRDEISIHTSIKSYLYKAVRNKSINYLKSKYANIDFEEETAVFNIADFNTPEHEIEKKELEHIINDAINNLPDKCFHIFSLSRYSPLSNKEIAEQLNITEKTVENQISIALKKIKSHLDKNI